MWLDTKLKTDPQVPDRLTTHLHQECWLGESSVFQGINFLFYDRKLEINDEGGRTMPNSMPLKKESGKWIS